MEHEEIASTHTAEKYLLGELTAQERNEFEQHLFVCAECAEDVRAAFIFADNAKAIFRESARPRVVEPRPARPEPRAGWFGWLKPAFAVPMAAAAGLFAVVTGYQSLVVIPNLRQELAMVTEPQALQPVTLRPMARGEAVEVRASGKLLLLAFDINAPQPFPAYTCEVVSEDGSVVYTVRAPAPAAGTPLTLLVPASRLKPGPYTLTVRGRSEGPEKEAGPVIDRYRFAILNK